MFRSWADKINLRFAGSRFYAPATLMMYWLFGACGFWIFISAIDTGVIYSRRGLFYLWSSPGGRLYFDKNPVVFVCCVGVSFLCSVFFFLVGWAKYSERENEIRSKTVTAQSPEISFAPAL